MGKSLLHSNDKSDIISLISKEANKNKSEREIKVNIPLKNGVMVKASIYI